MSGPRSPLQAPGSALPRRPRSRAPDWLLPLRNGYSILRWWLRGRPAPPPPCWKQRLVRRYGRRFRLPLLCETGTFFGDMVAACRGRFERIVSIEIDRRLYEVAAARFAGAPDVELLLGDSAELLPRLLERIDRPCLFWLDSKQMQGGVDCPVATPLRDELAAVLAHPVEGHVVLVDDARLFGGRAGFPRLREIETMVRAARPGWRVEVRHDVIRVHPPPPAGGAGRG